MPVIEWNESIEDKIILSCYCSAGDYIPDPDDVVRVIAELLPASIRGYDAEWGENLALFYN